MFPFKQKLTKSNIASNIKQRLLEEDRELFSKYRIKKAFLFGSMFNLRLGESAEVAILATPLANENVWKFRQELGVITGCPVDVFTQDDNPEFIKNVRETGIPVYG